MNALFSLANCLTLMRLRLIWGTCSKLDKEKTLGELEESSDGKLK